MSKVWLEIRYGSMPKGVLIGVTSNPKLLILAKRDWLQKIKKRLAEVEGLDQVLEIINKSELEKQQKVLDLLIPPETEELVLQTGGNGDG